MAQKGKRFPWSIGRRLEPPQLKVGGLAREHLVTQVEAAVAGGITLLAAPAGFGKTVLGGLLYERLSKSNWQCAWLSIGSEHGDSTTFRSDTRNALLKAGISVRVGRAESLADVSDSTHENEVLDALDGSRRRIAFFLDGLEWISQSRSKQCLERLVQDVPPRAHLILISRTRSAIDVGRHYVAGRVADLAAAQLRFNDEETEALLGDVAPRARVAEVLSWLEGWPVAIQLAKHFLAASPTASALMSLFAEGSAPLNSYIDAQLLATLSQRTREFLACAAELQTDTGELVDAARGQRDRYVVQTELAELAPLIRVSSDAASFHAHPAIAARLRHLPVISESRQDLHRRAADCLIGTRDAVGAIRHLVAAGEIKRAATLVDDVGLFKLACDIGPTLLGSLLRFIPTSALHELPRARAVWISTLLNEGRHDEAKAEYVRLKAEFQQLAPRKSAEMGADLATLDAYFQMLDDKFPSLEEVEKIGADAPRTDDPAAVLWRQQRGEFHRARDEIEELFGVFSRTAARFNLAALQTYRGMVAFGLGELDASEQAHLAAAALDPGRSMSRPSLMIDVPHAELLYERDALAAAKEILDNHAGHREDLEEWFDVHIARHTTNARIWAASGELDRGVAELRSRANLARDSGLRARHATLVGTCVELLLQGGRDPAEAAAIGEQLPKDLCEVGPAEILPWRLVEVVTLARARLTLAQGDAVRALEIAISLMGQWDHIGLVRGSVRSRLVAAAALVRLNRREESIQRLFEGLELARQTRHQRILLDEKEFLATLLAYYLQKPISQAPQAPLRDWIAALLRRLDLERKSQDRGSATPLSVREREVLIGISHGHTNKTIARTFGITVNTVKHHLRHVYRKLKVKRRMQAVDEARRRSLIP